MTHRRASTTRRHPFVRSAVAILPLLILIAACAVPAAPRTVAITSHADGERVFGSRTITLEGTANVAQVEVWLDGSVVTTVDVASDTFAAEVTLGDNGNEVRVQTTDALVGDDVDLVYPWVDATTFRPADVVIGQVDMFATAFGTSATEIGSGTYGTPVYVEGILYVPDAENHRILGFVGLPATNGAAADFVLGQATFAGNTHNDDDQDGAPEASPTARTLFCPSEVASDGTRLFVADSCNKRVLIFNALPTTNFAPADVVVGQATMTATAYTLCSADAPFDYPERLAAGGGRLVVPDSDGHRVLVWNTIPTANGTDPDLVLGQPGSVATCAPNDDDQDGVPDANPTARTLAGTYGSWMGEGVLVLNDIENNRFLLFVD